MFYAASFTGPGSPCRPLEVILRRVLAENENRGGDTSPGVKGNTYLRVRLRPQRKDQLDPSLTGGRLSGGLPSFRSTISLIPKCA